MENPLIFMQLQNSTCGLSWLGVSFYSQLFSIMWLVAILISLPTKDSSIGLIGTTIRARGTLLPEPCLHLAAYLTWGSCFIAQLNPWDTLSVVYLRSQGILASYHNKPLAEEGQPQVDQSWYASHCSAFAFAARVVSFLLSHTHPLCGVGQLSDGLSLSLSPDPMVPKELYC